MVLWYKQLIKGGFYLHFKEEFCLEPYLLKLRRGHRVNICKLRICNTKFPNETGRWRNVPRNERICPLCKAGLGDVYHFICKCTNFEVKDLRGKFIPPYYSKYPNVKKVLGMLKYCNSNVLSKLSIFIQKVEKMLV